LNEEDLLIGYNKLVDLLTPQSRIQVGTKIEKLELERNRIDSFAIYIELLKRKNRVK
jgi:hypothetical protein